MYLPNLSCEAVCFSCNIYIPASYVGERRTAEVESCTTGEQFAASVLEDR